MNLEDLFTLIVLDTPLGPPVCSTCYVHPSFSLPYVRLSATTTSSSIIMRAISNERLTSLSQVVVQPSITLLFPSDSLILVTPLPLPPISSPPFTLTFYAWRKFENWDEGVGAVRPCTYRFQPPPHFDLATLPLSSSLIASEESFVAIDFLDSIFILQVRFMNRDAEASDLRTVSMLDPDQCKGILPSSNASSPSSSMSTLLASSSHIIPLQSAEASLQTMLQIYHSLNFPSPSLPPIERRRPVYNTILLSGAAGSGKTSLLQSFASFINSASINKSSPTPLRVYYHSFKTSPLSLNESTTAAILAMIHSFEESPHDFKLFAELLASFLLAIDERNTSLSPSCLDSPSSPFVLLLDDVDAVLQALPRHFFNDVLESSAFDNTNSLQSSDTSLMASALKVIVSTIEIFNFPLLIIGATALTPSSLATCSAQGSIKFEKLILVQKPTSHDRKLLLLEMLKALIRDCGKLAAKEVSNIEKDNTDEWRSIWARQLAKLTPGYLPGDLKMLCRKICSLHKGSALRKATRSEEVVRKEMDWSLALKALSLTPPAQLHHLKDFIHVEDVFEEDVDSNTVNCGHTRESFMPAVRGYAEAKEKLRRIVKQISLAAGSNPLLPRGSLRSGIVLYGPSGNGKSLVAKCIAKELSARYLVIRCTELLSKYYGETEANIRSVFFNAVPPCLLFFDEFDTFAHKRGYAEDDSNGLQSRILSTFLNELDGTALRENEEEGGITVLVAAQSLVHLDDALLRPGRLSHHVYLGPPSTSDVLDILRHKLKDFPLAADLDIAIIAAELSVKRPSCADVESICKEAVMDAVREIITASESSQENEESALLTQCVSSGMSCLKFSNFARAFTLHFGVAPSF